MEIGIEWEPLDKFKSLPSLESEVKGILNISEYLPISPFPKWDFGISIKFKRVR